MTFGRALMVMAACAGVALVPSRARAQATAPHRYAVVIGANKASPGRRDLRYAHNDAQEIADTLIRVAGYGYDNVTVLLDPDPQQVLAALDAYLAREPSGTEALLFFYYSGHADAEALYPNGRPLSLRALRQRLDDERMNVRIGLIDACRGGGWTGAKGLTAAPPFPVEWPVALNNRGSVLDRVQLGMGGRTRIGAAARFVLHASLERGPARRRGSERGRHRHRERGVRLRADLHRPRHGCRCGDAAASELPDRSSADATWPLCRRRRQRRPCR